MDSHDWSMPPLIPRIRRAAAVYSVLLLLLSFSEARGAWDFGFASGQAWIADCDLRIVQPERQNDLIFEDVGYTSRSFTPPIYYVVRLGRPLTGNRLLGLEGEFIHMKAYADPAQSVRLRGTRSGAAIDSELPLGDIVQRFSISHGANLLLVNLVWRYSLGRSTDSGRFHLALRTGIGPTLLHVESTIPDYRQDIFTFDGHRNERYELQGPVYQASLALDGRIVPHISLFLEGKGTYTAVRGAGISFGSAETTLSALHLILGVEAAF